MLPVDFSLRFNENEVATAELPNRNHSGLAEIEQNKPKYFPLKELGHQKPRKLQTTYC